MNKMNNKTQNINKNRKANIISIWWFLVLALVGGAIVLGAVLFYSANIDVRKVETEILADKIVNCLKNQKVDNVEFINNFDFFKECELRRDAFEQESNYFVKVSIFEQDTNKELINRKFGNFGMEADYEVKKAVFSAKNYPESKERDFLIELSDGSKVVVRVLCVSNNIGRVLKNA